MGGPGVAREGTLGWVSTPWWVSVRISIFGLGVLWEWVSLEPDIP